VTVTLAVLTPSKEHPDAQQVLRHPGQVVVVVDSSTRKPIAATVKAWPESVQTGIEGDCPTYGKKPIDAQQSNSSDGRFVLRIIATTNTYTTTYCANDVFPRVDRDLGNSGDGTPVIPTPAELYPRAFDPTAYTRMVERRMIGLMNDLAYYQTI